MIKNIWQLITGVLLILVSILTNVLLETGNLRLSIAVILIGVAGGFIIGNTLSISKAKKVGEEKK